MISKQDVKHISELARIDLSDKEIEKYQEQLGGILDYVEKLKRVDTKDVKTSDGGTKNLENIFRDDEVKNSEIENKDLIKMAPEVDKNQVKVKSVF